MSKTEDGRVKRPAFQFYPGDWLRSTDLRSCSVGARGLWIDMICLMHEGTPYGHLKVNQKVIHPHNLARIVGATIVEVDGWLEELEGAGVCSRDGDGCYLSRRMIRDENTRQARVAGGKLGGNPNLKKAKGSQVEVGERLTTEVKQKPTPASASSSASAENVSPIGDTRAARSVAITAATLANQHGVDRQVAVDFLKIRKAKRLPLTQTAMDGLIREFTQKGLTVPDGMRLCAERGWAGFKHTWDIDGGTNATNQPGGRAGGFAATDAIDAEWLAQRGCVGDGRVVDVD